MSDIDAIKANLGKTYCIIEVENCTGWTGGGRWLHYVPSVGEELHTEHGVFIVTERYSVCDIHNNCCCLTITPHSLYNHLNKN